MTISAKIIQDSISNGTRIITFELEYPRFCHSEFMTHRLFSRNAASSRAIPIEAMNDLIKANPATPVHWGKNQPGMQANEELGSLKKAAAQHVWDLEAHHATVVASQLFRIGLHKQVANRVTEPFQHMKVVVTATEFANWFWLRDHPDAQPEIKVLAQEMFSAMSESKPMVLNPGEWHVPYVDRARTSKVMEYLLDDAPIDLDAARKVSASCCAQVSYRKTDMSLEKANKIYSMLIESEPCHASPVEHQATPMNNPVINTNKPFWPDGATHITKDGRMWSGNFCGWIQFRQLIPNNAKW